MRLESKMPPSSGYNTGHMQMGVDYPAIAQELCEEYHPISYNKQIYIYTDDGTYKINNSEIENAIIQKIKERRHSGTKSFTEPIKQILTLIWADTSVNDYPFNNVTNKIPVNNGVLTIDVKTKNISLESHSPKFLFTYKLPVDYNTDVNPNEITDYFKSLDVDMTLLLQIPAHSLLSMMGKNYKKCYLLKGHRNSGKTTYLNLLEKGLFGNANSSNIPLHEIVNDRFKASGLVGKIVNIADELPRIRLGDLSRFKALTGGGTILVERKYQNPFSIQNKAVLIFATNDYPPITDIDDEAFWSRWGLIEFNKMFDVDPTFEERIITPENCSAMLNLVLKRMIEIDESGRINSQSIKEVKDMWLHGSDPLYRFISTRLKRDIDGLIGKTELYGLYKQYCKENNEIPVSDIEFNRKMIEHGSLLKQKVVNEKRFRCYLGFVLK